MAYLKIDKNPLLKLPYEWTSDYFIKNVNFLDNEYYKKLIIESNGDIRFTHALII